MQFLKYFIMMTNIFKSFYFSKYLYLTFFLEILKFFITKSKVILLRIQSNEVIFLIYEN